MSPLSPRWRQPGRTILILWVFSLLIMSLAPVLYGAHTTYAPRGLTCSLTPYVSITLNMITFVIFFCVPMVTIVGANIVILVLVYSTKTRADRKPYNMRKASLTISVLCWVYIVSYIPSAMFVVLYLAGCEMPVWAYITTQYALGLNVIANPVVYTMTNRRFAEFIRTLFVKSEEKDCPRNSTVMSVLSKRMSTNF